MVGDNSADEKLSPADPGPFLCLHGKRMWERCIPCESTAQSGTPVRKEFSAEQLVCLYRAFLVQQCGAPKDMEGDTRDQFYARVGLMVQFTNELFEFKP